MIHSMSLKVLRKTKSRVFSRYSRSQACWNSATPAIIGNVPKFMLPMLSEQISGENVRAAAVRSSSVMPRPAPVVRLITTSLPSWIAGRNCANTAGS